MIAKRIIPQFLLKGSRLVKGTNFKNYIDVGDPLSQAVIYDAQGAEEIIIVDIEATRQNRTINTDVIHRMITRCRLPISAGGGIKSLKDAEKCFNAGADKIILNSVVAENPDVIKEFTREFGSANVVVSVDVKKTSTGKYNVYSRSGSKKIRIDIFELLKMYITNGAGEIVLTSIDREGTLTGFDLDLIYQARKIVTVPLIASGGAGSYDDIVHVFFHTEVDAVAIGKMLFLRDYDIVRIKSYLQDKHLVVRDA